MSKRKKKGVRDHRPEGALRKENACPSILDHVDGAQVHAIQNEERVARETLIQTFGKNAAGCGMSSDTLLHRLLQRAMDAVFDVEYALVRDDSEALEGAAGVLLSNAVAMHALVLRTPHMSGDLELAVRLSQYRRTSSRLPAMRETAMHQISYLPGLARAILKTTIVGLAIAGLVSDDQADALILVLGLRDA